MSVVKHSLSYHTGLRNQDAAFIVLYLLSCVFFVKFFSHISRATLLKLVRAEVLCQNAGPLQMCNQLTV